MEYITKLIEKIAYKRGVNFNYYNTDAVISKLRESAPKSFFGRKISDIGCGDGVNTIKIAKVLKAIDVCGYDISMSLVDKAKDRGLKVVVVNRDEKITGDLGVLWGVVHHFADPVEDMVKIVKNFKSFLIREPTDRWRILEAGKRIPEPKMTNMVELVAKKCGKKVVKVLANENQGKSVLYFIG